MLKKFKIILKKRKNLTTGQIELILKKIKLLFQKILKQIFLKKILLNQFQELKSNIN